jgi:hypothetical protein
MSGTATKTTGAVLIPQTDPGAVTLPGASLLCNFCDCAYTEYAFSDAGADAWKNDKTSFLFRRYAPGDTVALELWKAGTKVADVNTSTWGQYYPFGAFPQQPDYTAWLADWKLVADAFGFGTYTVKAVQVLQGVPSTIESRRFRCSPYDDVVADGTVKIEWWQQGNIIGSAFDFTTLAPIGGGWYSSLRIPGRLGKKTPIIEADSYVDSAYRKTQIQDSVRTEYELETLPLPQEIADVINYNAVLGNRIVLTDYSAGGPYPYIPLELYAVSVEPKHLGGKDTSYVIKFESRVTSAVKRNF